MKIPSLIKIPRHQKFHIEPRYYDPVKEEIERRERLILAEINAEKKKGTYKFGNRISSAFNHQKIKTDNSSILRFLVATLLFGGTVGYLYMGMLAIYMSFGFVILFFIFKKFKRF